MEEFLKELNKGTSPSPKESIFNDIMNEYERVVLHSLITTFGLDFIVRDQDGGDVDTIHNIRSQSKDNVVYKNSIYNERYKGREPYDPALYHSDPSFAKIKKDARDLFNETGIPLADAYSPGNTLFLNGAKGISPWRRANLDHIISAHEIHDDPVRILANLSGIELANDSSNLDFTSESLNKKMQDKSIPEFIKWCEENPDKVKWNGEENSPLPEDVKEKLLAEDQRARQAYEKRLAEAYYSNPQFYLDSLAYAAKLGVEMGLRQVLGFVFLEIWFACKNELVNIPAGSSVGDIFKALVRGVENGAVSVKDKYRELLSQFEQGAISGILASVITTVCNIFVTTEKNTIKYIRNGCISVVHAGKVILVNPDDLRLGDQIERATVILATGACTFVGSVIGDSIGKTPLGNIPTVGPLVQRFISVLVSGLMSCTLLLVLDRSWFINDIVAKMNFTVPQCCELKQISEQFSVISAEVFDYDIEQFREDAYKFDTLSKRMSSADSEDELQDVLDSFFTVNSIQLPWEGDLDDFLLQGDRPLVF